MSLTFVTNGAHDPYMPQDQEQAQEQDQEQAQEQEQDQDQHVQTEEIKNIKVIPLFAVLLAGTFVAILKHC
jgi:hypothetical protein